jgi:hypothetical protein
MKNQAPPILSALLALALAAPAPSPAQGPPPVRQEPIPVNLARLEGTALLVSSVNGGREQDNAFYGAPNLIDGGENAIDGINYTYWLTDSATRHWIRLRFEAPAEVRSVMLEFNVAKTGSAERPGEFALDVASLAPGGQARVEKLASIRADPPAGEGAIWNRQAPPGSGEAGAPSPPRQRPAPIRPEDADVPLGDQEPPFFPQSASSRQAFPPRPVEGFRVYYPLEEPLRQVVELGVVFPGPSMIAVSEIEVMGFLEPSPEEAPPPAPE